MTTMISFLIPVYNGAAHLAEALDAIFAQDDFDSVEHEVVAIDDGSSDASPEILARYSAEQDVRVLRGPRRGAAAALNLGIREARGDLIAQIDQDVVLRSDWLGKVLAAWQKNPDAAAVQGQYVIAKDASFWERVTGLDLHLRYAALHGGSQEPVATDHVCTGVTLYRRGALMDVGLFDEQLGYGYDNDLSYRLGGAGHRLLLCGGAQAVHHGRGSLGTYLRQQYGLGYGRLDVVAKFFGRQPKRAAGDDVSGLLMMLHAPLMLLALVAWIFPHGWKLSLCVFAFLAAERAWAGVRAARQACDLAGLAFPLVHLLRDVAWAFAIIVWTIRRIFRRPSRPDHSHRL